MAAWCLREPQPIPMLSPTLVQRHPTYDGRMIIERRDHAIKLQHELLVMLVRPVCINHLAPPTQTQFCLPPHRAKPIITSTDQSRKQLPQLNRSLRQVVVGNIVGHRGLNVVQIAFSPDDADDFDAIVESTKKDYVVSTCETATYPVVSRLARLSHLWVYCQHFANAFDGVDPTICSFGLVSRAMYSAFSYRSRDASSEYRTLAIKTVGFRLL